VRISLLGPLHVDGELGTVKIGAAKERSLLSTLALTPGCIVSTDALITALWGDEPPASARKTLQTYVWNLRQAFGSDIIATDPAGYALCVGSDDVDVGRFRALVRRADDAMRAGDVEQARALLTEAVALWRDEPFRGAAPHSGLANQAVRLKEEYLSALEARIAADLAAGRHNALVSELEALVREHPYREKLWGSLMVALYGSGRQADALDAYQRVRDVLLEELGLEPGGELRRLEAANLNHDPSIGAPPTPIDGSSTSMRRSPVRYARCADGVNVAYQVAGDGPIDILAIPGFVSHLDIWWNAPTDRLVRRLTGMGRLIWLDKRGIGLSDRPEHVDVEHWLDDALAVLDDVGSERAVILGVSAGSLTALTLAARHPERVRALAIHGGFARSLVAPDHPIGWDRETVEWFGKELEAGWGTGTLLEFYAPSRAEDPFVRDYWTRYQLLSASPSSAMRFYWAAMEADVRDVLPDIKVPTLVVHANQDVIVPVAHAHHIAEHVRGAEFVGLDSNVHLICVSDVIDQLTDAIESFIGRIVHA
jgi:DNA-binding SARP family transcriptional activator/pimeloyl-ACP methyl ester carboxylesterase